MKAKSFQFTFRYFTGILAKADFYIVGDKAIVNAAATEGRRTHLYCNEHDLPTARKLWAEWKQTEIER